MKKWILVLALCLLPIRAFADGAITTARKIPKLGADGKIERLPYVPQNGDVLLDEEGGIKHYKEKSGHEYYIDLDGKKWDVIDGKMRAGGDGVYVPQVLQVKDGDILYNNSKWEGLVENLNDVTFVRWNFSRSTPHTEVFKNCTKLSFYQCNLNNVEIPTDSTVIDCLTIHQEEKLVGSEIHRIVECGDNKTRTYLIKKENLDIVEADLLDKGIPKAKIPDIKKAVVDTYIEQGKETIIIDGKVTEELIDTKETPIEKSYKSIKRFIR